MPRWVAIFALSALSLPAVAPAGPDAADPPDAFLFLQLASHDRETAEEAMRQVADAWHDGYTTMIVDIARLLRPGQVPRPGAGSGAALERQGASASGRFDSGEDTVRRGADPSAPDIRETSRIRRRLIRFLEEQTGQRFGDDLDKWRHWMWSLPYRPHPDYAYFKGGVFGNIDLRMRAFFPRGAASSIRLDKVDWGGVHVNGIPPLHYPEHVSADDARYLKDKHLVFGIFVNGQARAYPKRILAWHEVVRDVVGGVELTVVYCTLCGTVIPYESEVEGRRFTFGTSGFLYKSNKLLFDEETNSLWSSVYGEPVIGSLVGSGIRLVSHPVVTTTWGEWKAAHPDTRVLSLETGYDRNYREGAAYGNYSRNDRLMFEVAERDDRLKNKDEVLVFPAFSRSPRGGRPLAIDVALLQEQRIFHATHDETRLVVLTSAQGANRAYEIGDEEFVRWIDDERIEDTRGGVWEVQERALVPVVDGSALPRLASHRVFWFAWYAQYPQTRLIH